MPNDIKNILCQQHPGTRGHEKYGDYAPVRLPPSGALANQQLAPFIFHTTKSPLPLKSGAQDSTTEQYVYGGTHFAIRC